ncbi:hypothetical protein L873DRAFT_464334 [Choiromyces venosus 120613-1]|uniref:Uncharacterized protein n=1 Tax=Choiromyces venosus 120613-1 TaxID=1336337 RepID=A0A3N4JVR1_9PEZI|nr:hypothetical protein L873DRAFT_464334 [Choiromyces venosus 120613-1]
MCGFTALCILHTVAVAGIPYIPRGVMLVYTASGWICRIYVNTCISCSPFFIPENS